MKLELSETALRDLDDIWRYVAQDNARAADRLIDRLLESVEPLTAFPNMGVAREDLTPGLRALRVDNYIVFYEKRLSVLMVERVLHGRLDITGSDF